MGAGLTLLCAKILICAVLGLNNPNVLIAGMLPTQATLVALLDMLTLATGRIARADITTYYKHMFKFYLGCLDYRAVAGAPGGMDCLGRFVGFVVPIHMNALKLRSPVICGTSPRWGRRYELVDGLWACSY
jgi:hypothetical protein